MPRKPEQAQESMLKLLTAEAGEVRDGVSDVRLQTDKGAIGCRLHPADSGDAALLWVFGAGGGFFGPAGGLYDRLGRQFTSRGVSSLELAYRQPGHLVPCVLDTLAGVAYLAGLGRRRVVVVGHSFGGAVVIQAGLHSEEVIAVAALSSQTYGAGAVEELSPKPLFLAHGEADEVLPDACSRSLYRQAGQPKEMKLYPGCRHGLDECREELDRDLTGWVERVLAAPGS